MNKYLYRTDERRTIRQWLRAIEDPIIREQALANHKSAPKSATEATKLSRALVTAFDWADSPEGDTYWSSFKGKIADEEEEYNIIKDWACDNSKTTNTRCNAARHLVLYLESKESPKIAEVIDSVQASKEEESHDRAQFKPSKVS